MPRALKLLPQLAVVVDFAVENQDGIAIVTDHGLIAVLQIDDLEAHGSQRDIRRFPNALLVRTAMSQRPRDPPNGSRIGLRPRVSEPGYAAQMTKSPWE